MAGRLSPPHPTAQRGDATRRGFGVCGGRALSFAVDLQAKAQFGGWGAPGGGARTLAGGPHGHLQEDHLSVLGRVALVDVPREARRAVEGGRAVLAGEHLRRVQQAQVALLGALAGERLPAHGAQVALGGRAQAQHAGSLAVAPRLDGRLLVGRRVQRQQVLGRRRPALGWQRLVVVSQQVLAQIGLAAELLGALVALV